jgi:hypothetical protein
MHRLSVSDVCIYTYPTSLCLWTHPTSFVRCFPSSNATWASIVAAALVSRADSILWCQKDFNRPSLRLPGNSLFSVVLLIDKLMVETHSLDQTCWCLSLQTFIRFLRLHIQDHISIRLMVCLKVCTLQSTFFHFKQGLHSLFNVTIRHSTMLPYIPGGTFRFRRVTVKREYASWLTRGNFYTSRRNNIIITSR